MFITLSLVSSLVVFAMNYGDKRFHHLTFPGDVIGLSFLFFYNVKGLGSRYTHSLSFTLGREKKRDFVARINVLKGVRLSIDISVAFAFFHIQLNVGGSDFYATLRGISHA